MQDIECDKSNIPRALFMDHVFAHLLMTYGAKNMVTEFAACLMVSAKRHRAVDLRIEVCTLLACDLAGYQELKTGSKTGYDIVFPSSYMAEVMHKQGWLMSLKIVSSFATLRPDSS